MKDILKTLASQKEAVEKEFGMLQKSQTQLQQQLNQVGNRIVQLQGKFQQIVQLEQDFKDEPKEKKDG